MKRFDTRNPCTELEIIAFDDKEGFKGQIRSNDTHESKTDSDARLYRKGSTASELRFMGHTLSDNRHGLIANAVVTTADGYAGREAANIMIPDAKQSAGESARLTLGADKGYDAAEFIEALLRDRGIDTVGLSRSMPAEISFLKGTSKHAAFLRGRRLIHEV